MSRIVSSQSNKAHGSGSQHTFSAQNLGCSGHTAVRTVCFIEKHYDILGRTWALESWLNISQSMILDKSCYFISNRAC